MIEYLEQLDKLIFVFINSCYSPFWDSVMWFVSAKWAWIPLYLILLFYLIKQEKKQVWIALLFVVLLITLTDQISVKLFKEVFLRYRPCHNVLLRQQVHLVDNHCGGLYGFVSSHAANSFALATFFAVYYRVQWVSLGLIFWAILVAYSRVYLGVHYPADVACGALLGISIGLLTIALYIKTNSFIKPKR